jgi:predicted peroxiredoxin
MARSLVLKVTVGKNDPERCNQAFNVEASWLALPGECPDLGLPHATPLDDLLATVLAAGRVTLCSQCAARRDIGEADVIDGIRIAGAATFLAEVLEEGAQALVY